MKKILIALLFSAEACFGQMDLPERSPEGRMFQQVGYTTFSIRYGRPAARERKIMGGLVPYGRLWRTGAGKCSTISFDRQVVINNKTIAAGIYAIATIPGEKMWTFMLNSDTSKIFGDPSEYDQAYEVVRVEIHTEKTNRFYESLTFDLDIVRSDAILALSWENTRIRLLIETGSHRQALATINRELSGHPRDVYRYAQAAYYYYMNNENLEQALQWLNTAITQDGDLDGRRWVYEQRVDILERMRRYPEARKAVDEATVFLRRTKPAEWETEIRGFSERTKSWPAE